MVLVALGLSHGPLLWDLSLVYRGSLDAVVLAAVIGTIVHLFLWIVLWLLLTVKVRTQLSLLGDNAWLRHSVPFSSQRPNRITLRLMKCVNFVLLSLWEQSKWEFKLRVTVARACVASARSIKLVNDVELISNDPQNHAHTPLLVVGAGKAYAITDATPKKSIMSVVQKVRRESF